LSFGGTATLFLTAAGNAAGPAADTIHPLVVTVWNAAIAGGGLLGGVLLSAGGAPSQPWSLLALLIPAMLLALHARRNGFPMPAGSQRPAF
jgi:predicted MFS family arabinose efflux permease